MTKYECDRCKKQEEKPMTKLELPKWQYTNDAKTIDLCEECYNDFRRNWLNPPKAA